jgi:hypothetical protein
MTGRRRRRRRRRRKLLDDLKEREGNHTEGGSSRSHYVESSLCKRLWTCRKTDYQMNEDLHADIFFSHLPYQKTLTILLSIYIRH